MTYTGRFVYNDDIIKDIKIQDKQQTNIAKHNLVITS
jgi:hypothetical protein